MSSKNMKKSIVASSIGNILEWYEYTLYAYFASVISDLFFPLQDHSVAMIMTFATFAVSLAARPIGGIIFGYIGDRYSRKKTLAIAMLTMSIPTACIGLLPTYASIGVWAPVILVCLRILQGIALGGEFGASCVYLYESAPANKKGFFGTIALTGVGLGLVLSSGTIFVIESLYTKAEVYEYAWRIPFFVSVVGSFVAFYMRRNLFETQDFVAAKQANNLVRNPFFEMMKNHKLTLLGLFSIFLTTQISFFVVFIYGKTMMIDCLNYSARQAGQFSLLTVVSYTISTVVCGYLSDKFDKKYIILFGTLLMALSAQPFIAALEGGNTSAIVMMCITLGFLIGMTEGTLNPLVAESFPVNIRATSVSFSWNFTAVAFGGCAPIISMWLIDRLGSIYAVSYYLIGACLITMTGLLISIFASKLQSDALPNTLATGT